MSAETPKPPCAVCKGEYKEHFDEQGKPITQHAYTEKPGELVTHEERAKQNQTTGGGSQTQRIPINPSMLGQNMNVGRLAEVLLANSLISNDQALYIAGMRSTPGEPPNKFMDPMALMGGN